MLLAYSTEKNHFSRLKDIKKYCELILKEVFRILPGVDSGNNFKTIKVIISLNYVLGTFCLSLIAEKRKFQKMTPNNISKSFFLWLVYDVVDFTHAGLSFCVTWIKMSNKFANKRFQTSLFQRELKMIHHWYTSFWLRSHQKSNFWVNICFICSPYYTGVLEVDINVKHIAWPILIQSWFLIFTFYETDFKY